MNYCNPTLLMFCDYNKLPWDMLVSGSLCNLHTWKRSCIDARSTLWKRIPFAVLCVCQCWLNACIEALTDLGLLAVSNTGDSVINWTVGSCYFLLGLPFMGLPFIFEDAEYHRLFAHTVHKCTRYFNGRFSRKPGSASSPWFSVSTNLNPERPHRTSQSSP